MVTVERAALAGLWSVSGIGEGTIAQLKNTFELAEIARLPPSEWINRARLKPNQRLALEGPTLVERGEALLHAAERSGVRVAFEDAPEFPEMLRRIPSHPPLLFFQGKGEVPGKRRVAMVGTRTMDNDFRGLSAELAQTVARQGIGIVSGAARGVDSECHRGALVAKGETWAVLGSSIDQIDRQPKTVVDYLLEHGGTVWSDYPPGVRPERSNFVRRNRLIAWMADVTLMTRGEVDSGALYTVDFALEWNRPVLVVPGEIDNPKASGPNVLLRDPRVRPCLGIDDVLAALGLQPDAVLQHTIPFDDSVPLSERAQRALAALGKETLGFDEWLARADPLTPTQLTCSLVELELSGRVVECPGKVYLARG